MPTVYGREVLVEGLQNASGHERKGMEGELRVLNRLEQVLPLHATVIVKPAIGNLEPDFIVVLPNEGFFVIEVKNFALRGIREVLSNGALKFSSGNIANPLSQVTAHTEQLNQFTMSNFGLDVYKCIGKLVVFAGFTKPEFMQAFQQNMLRWEGHQQANFERYHAFVDELEGDFFTQLKNARKFAKTPFHVQRSVLLDMALLMKPRPNVETAVLFEGREALLDVDYFSQTLTQLTNKDAENGTTIQRAIDQLLQRELPYLQGAKTYEQAYLALMNLKGAIKAESSTYLNFINELKNIENKMLNERTRIVEQFKRDIQLGIHNYFSKQLQDMKYHIEKNTKWHSSLTDTSKKAAAIMYNPLLKIAKKSVASQKKLDDLDEIDGRSGLEKTLEQHLDSKKIEATYNLVMKTAIVTYEKNWKEVIAQHTPNLKGLQTFSSSIHIHNQQLKHQLGASEQVLGLTVGSAVIGTIGLAAGWHTFTYAALNVFPPIAVFAVIATIATAVIRKDHEVQKQQKQLEDAVKSYEEHLFQQIDPPRLTQTQRSVFSKIEKASDAIVHETIAEWERQLFGSLHTADYQALIEHLLRYADSIDQAINDVKQRMELEMD